VCCCIAAAVRPMPDSHKLSSRPRASIFALPAPSASSTSSMLRFLLCGAAKFSLSANTLGMCDVTFFSGLRAGVASDAAVFLGSVEGELIARGVRSPRARREGVW
jgi:hypothetical protein